MRDFTTFKATSNFPVTIGVVGDLGVSINASQTVRQMVRTKQQIVINVGDLAYAGGRRGGGGGGAAGGCMQAVAEVSMALAGAYDLFVCVPLAYHISHAHAPSADIYLPTGRQAINKKFKYALTYQPRWDMYGRMMQQLAGFVPVMTSTGNRASIG